jgi:hypothetical protein
MRKRILLLLIMVAVLLLNSAAQAQRPVTDQTQATVLTGGSYHLITLAEETTASLTSAKYRLLPAAPTAGEGCCCKSLLPCVVK